MGIVMYRLTLSATESPALTALALEESRTLAELAALMVTDALRLAGLLDGDPVRPQTKFTYTNRDLPPGQNRRLVLRFVAEEAEALVQCSRMNRRSVQDQARYFIREQLAAVGLLPDDPLIELTLLRSGHVEHRATVLEAVENESVGVGSTPHDG